MRTEILLTLLLTLLTFALALPSTGTTSNLTKEMDNLPLAAVPYPADTTSRGEVEGLFTSGNVTGTGEFDGWYQCETSKGSPRIDDIRGAAQTFESLGNRHCVQENAHMTFCTKMVHFQSAAVSICGPYMNWIYCNRVALAANTVADRCGWNGLAGGYFVFENPRALNFPIHKN